MSEDDMDQLGRALSEVQEMKRREDLETQIMQLRLENRVLRQELEKARNLIGTGRNGR